MMGNPASSSIANFIMDALKSLDYVPGIKIYYVDDSLYSIPRDKIEHPSLKFTYELEQDRKNPFRT